MNGPNHALRSLGLGSLSHYFSDGGAALKEFADFITEPSK